MIVLVVVAAQVRPGDSIMGLHGWNVVQSVETTESGLVLDTVDGDQKKAKKYANPIEPVMVSR
jgi:hypothetical protein